MLSPRRRVALFMEVSTAYDHGVARGIMRYARTLGNWQLFGYGWSLARIRDKRTWDGDGIITRVLMPEEVPHLLALNVPIVDVCRTLPHPRVHSAANDDWATGRAAADHMLAAGHHRFAFCGAPEGEWSNRRWQGFMDRVGISREKIPTLLKSRTWWHRQGGPGIALKTWLKTLELPIAILAADDSMGVKLTMACAELHLRVPEDIAIVGVDNEEVLCEMSNPTLTSVPCDTERMGYEAAALLDQLMKNGEPREAQHVVIPPLPIVVRGSSDSFATKDSAVLAALRLIHQDDHPALHVPEVVLASGLSRRALEQRFRKELNRTIHDEIHRARMQRACHMLLTTNQPVAKIAIRCGFSSPQRFYSVFGQTFGMSALEYREKQKIT